MVVKMYTDGASSGNPGPGGYGTYLVSGQHKKTLSEGFRRTTNNRMELMAVIKGLEAMKKSGLQIEIYSDSKYVVDAINKKWLNGWVKKGFAKTKNPDLWKRYLEVSKGQKVKFIWVKGHAGHAENELCDQLAVEASQMPDLKTDVGYEQSQKDSGLF